MIAEYWAKEKSPLQEKILPYFSWYNLVMITSFPVMDLHINNEEQIIYGCPIDGAISVRVDCGFGSYRWFVYITTLLLRNASWILILHCGTPERL